MSTNTDKEILLLDELQSVLEKQVRLARQGNINDVEPLTERAGFLMGKITGSGILELPEFRNYQERVQRLYKDLRLVLAAQKAEVAEELSRIRKGKKTIQAYRSNA